MTAKEHRPEPWHMDTVNCSIWSADGRWIVGPPKGLQAEARALSLANGQRIVAAVNACAGVPTEQLTPGLVARLLDNEERSK